AAESPLYPGNGNDGGAVALDGLAVDLLRVGVELNDVRDALDEGLVDHRRDLSASMISRSVGNRPSSCFEKMRWLSTLTSKIPPLPRTRRDSTPSSFLISAARLEARGR